ncbi:MAG TPA: hypothetical protein VMT73_09085 [Anaerolineales bacterium]|nr:hypothetical protein [Anaerolineales bacterium]
MQPLISPSDASARPDVLRAKQIYGFTYGLVVGVGFAFATWGMDAYVLSQSNALFPWIKLIVGAVLCAIVGAPAGWLALRLERELLAVVIWLAAGAWLAWMTIILPLQITPRLLSFLEPSLREMLHYTYFEEFAVRFGVAYTWVAIFIAIIGLLELPLSEPAIFATSAFGRIIPFLVCLVIVGISGSIVDGLNNEPLRTALVTTNQSIQFAVDHQGQTVDPQLARQMHQSALNTITNLLPQPRRLIVQDFNQDLGQVHVLVRFGDQWVQCLSLYNQLSNCNAVSP